LFEGNNKNVETCKVEQIGTGYFRVTGLQLYRDANRFSQRNSAVDLFIDLCRSPNTAGQWNHETGGGNKKNMWNFDGDIA
jgi:hypothetical protein